MKIIVEIDCDIQKFRTIIYKYHKQFGIDNRYAIKVREITDLEVAVFNLNDVVVSNLEAKMQDLEDHMKVHVSEEVNSRCD